MYVIQLESLSINSSLIYPFSFSPQFNNIFEARSVFMQTAYSLAVAEEALQFEHRDLHWGNILVKSTKAAHQNYVLMGQDMEVESHGIRACIIDFTLSRLRKGEIIALSCRHAL